jgi:DNA-binding transcriptional ArsR family regulator
VNKADLILHPARLKIILALTNGAKTTQEIANDLGDVPKSSIYRHLKVLLESGMIAVGDTRSVKGTEERMYELVQKPHLNMEDVVGYTKEDHLRYITSYLATVLQGFSDYLSNSPQVDLLQDRVGFTEVTIAASTEELDHIFQQVQQALTPGQDEENPCNRRRHKFVFITYPVESKGAQDGHHE